MIPAIRMVSSRDRAVDARERASPPRLTETGRTTRCDAGWLGTHFDNPSRRCARCDVHQPEGRPTYNDEQARRADANDDSS